MLTFGTEGALTEPSNKYFIVNNMKKDSKIVDHLWVCIMIFHFLFLFLGVVKR
jgi:hypothetical protein